MPTHPPAVAELLPLAPPVALGPGRPGTALRARLQAACADLPPVCAAGLWLRFDFLDDAHAVCQDDESCPDRNFWHAVLHRREPDAGNAKYWWRRVGPHPVLKALAARAPEVGYRYTTPEAFVDFCDRARGTGSTDEDTARRVQQLEWELMFEYGLTRA